MNLISADLVSSSSMNCFTSNIDYNYFTESTCWCFNIYYLKNSDSPLDILRKNKCVEMADIFRMNFNDVELAENTSVYRPNLRRTRSDSYSVTSGDSVITTTTTQSQEIPRLAIGSEADNMRSDLETFKNENRKTLLCVLDYCLCSLLDLRKRRVVRRLKERGYKMHVFQSDVISIHSAAKEPLSRMVFSSGKILRDDECLKYDFKERKFTGMHLNMDEEFIKRYEEFIHEIENAQGNLGFYCKGCWCFQMRPKPVADNIKPIISGFKNKSFKCTFENGKLKSCECKQLGSN